MANKGLQDTLGEFFTRVNLAVGIVRDILPEVIRVNIERVTGKTGSRSDAGGFHGGHGASSADGCPVHGVSSSAPAPAGECPVAHGGPSPASASPASAATEAKAPASKAKAPIATKTAAKKPAPKAKSAKSSTKKSAAKTSTAKKPAAKSGGAKTKTTAKASNKPAAKTTLTAAQIAAMTRKELYAEAQALDIHGRKDMKKADLQKAINATRK